MKLKDGEDFFLMWNFFSQYDPAMDLIDECVSIRLVLLYEPHRRAE